MTSLEHEENFEKVAIGVLNPKSITMGQLYGYVDSQTTEWVDGTLAKLVLDCSKDESPTKHWIMFDGPVDALWIENMNTVLDDNKKLCLNSGQIITLTPRMTMMFEVEDLAVASPATVSRCGMVYMEPGALTLHPLIISWLNTLPEKVAARESLVETLKSLCFQFIDDTCYYMRKHCLEPVETVDNNLCQSMMRIMDSFLADFVESEIKIVTSDQIDELEAMVGELFFYSVSWSLAATVDAEGRRKMDIFLREKLKDTEIEIPDELTIFDWCFDRQNATWVKWTATKPEFSVDTKLAFNEIVVPTDDSIRMKYLLRLLLTTGKHVLTPGPTGTGKTVNISEMLSHQLPEEY